MRGFHLVHGWGILIAAIICLTAITTFAGGTSDDNYIKIVDLPFNMVVHELVKDAGGKSLCLLTEDSTRVSISEPRSTPLDVILKKLAAQVNLDFWQDDSTYFIGKRETPAPTPSLTPAPVVSPLLTSSPPPTDSTTSGTPISAGTSSVVKEFVLQYASAGEVAWMLGGQTTSDPSHERQGHLKSQIQTLFDPRNPTVVGRDSGTPYQSQVMNSIMAQPASYSDANQIGVNPIGVNPIGVNPIGTNPIGTNPIGTNPVNGNGGNGGNGANGANSGQGVLKAFLPDGIETIVGIDSLNVLFVRSKNTDALDQLAGFIKMLDKPTKQALVECMFVKMSILDAMSLGSSWAITAPPWDVVSNNGGPTGSSTTGTTTGTSSNPDLSLSYANGNVKFALSALVSTSKARVVDAPRVLVQSGGAVAQIMLMDSVPFVTTAQSTDLYGNASSNPTISVQSIPQILAVSNVTIYPDNSVSMLVQPTITDVTSQISLPGTSNTVSGSLSATSQVTCPTYLHVKNGETVLMAGYVSTNDSSSTQKTPLLGNLPIIGPLFFQQVATTNNTTQTLLFVTPTVLLDDNTDFPGMTSSPPIF